MILLSCLWWYLRRANFNLFIIKQPLIKIPLIYRVIVSLAVGYIIGVSVSYLSKKLVFKYNWAKSLCLEFKYMLYDLRHEDIFVFSLVSAISEEIFFRGILLQEIGIIISSLLFGMLHIGSNIKFLIWTFHAIVFGFLFGFLFLLTGTIISPIITHFTINYYNLKFIKSYEPLK